MRLDASDLLILVGTALAAVGLWLIYPPVALIVLGLWLIVAGVRAAR